LAANHPLFLAIFRVCEAVDSKAKTNKQIRSGKFFGNACADCRIAITAENLCRCQRGGWTNLPDQLRAKEKGADWPLFVTATEIRASR